MKKKNICFIINPISGGGKQKNTEALIKRKLDVSQFVYNIFYTEALGHAAELSKKAVNLAYDVVVAVGGDGSVNEVAQGLINSHVALAVLPTGSGNGFARHLNIPLNIEEAIELINCFNIKKIDTATVNEKLFLNIAGVGFDAHVGWKFSQSKKRGFTSYIKIVIKEFYKYIPKNYKIDIAGKTISRKAFLISFANGSQYGNNAFIAPQALMDDSLIDICILKKFPLTAVPGLVYKLFKKRLHASKFVEVIRCSSFTIYQEDSEIIHVDGEPLKGGKILQVKINPLSLNVIAP